MGHSTPQPTDKRETISKPVKWNMQPHSSPHTLPSICNIFTVFWTIFGLFFGVPHDANNDRASIRYTHVIYKHICYSLIIVHWYLYTKHKMIFCAIVLQHIRLVHSLFSTWNIAKNCHGYAVAHTMERDRQGQRDIEREIWWGMMRRALGTRTKIPLIMICKQCF